MSQAMAETATHVQRVRRLYKLILRLHRALPADVRAFGDEYVRDEFKRHKDAEPQFVPVFMHEWRNYAVTLAQQLGKRTTQQALGVKLSEDKLNALRGDQIGQLFELFQHIQSQPSTHHQSSSQTREAGTQLDSSVDNNNSRTTEAGTKSHTPPTIAS